MDIDLLRGLATVSCMAAFFAVLLWAYSPSRKSRFEEDARMPFAEDEGDDR
jgi:cytochrome c oxidase cbb3-type subunit 4